VYRILVISSLVAPLTIWEGTATSKTRLPCCNGTFRTDWNQKSVSSHEISESYECISLLLDASSSSLSHCEIQIDLDPWGDVQDRSKHPWVGPHRVVAEDN